MKSKRLNPEWVGYAVNKMRSCSACVHEKLVHGNDGRVHAICELDGSIVDWEIGRDCFEPEREYEKVDAYIEHEYESVI